jgi:hypothetical protein
MSEPLTAERFEQFVDAYTANHGELVKHLDKIDGSLDAIEKMLWQGQRLEQMAQRIFDLATATGHPESRATVHRRAWHGAAGCQQLGHATRDHCGHRSQLVIVVNPEWGFPRDLFHLRTRSLTGARKSEPQMTGAPAPRTAAPISDAFAVAVRARCRHAFGCVRQLRDIARCFHHLTTAPL